jgi:SSU ribosomal protein S14P
MAKESMKAREVKRAKLVAKYAEKRAALKQIVRTGDPADAFEAAQKLQELPKNSNPIRMHNRCKLTGVLKVIFVNSEFREFNSVRWHLTD